MTLDGTACSQVSVVFDPKDGVGAPSQGMVADGHFSFMSPPGPKIVRISGTRLAGTTKDGDPNYVSLVPPKYNSRSTLEVMVNPLPQNTYSFELKSK